jgi:hypothetical protein
MSQVFSSLMTSNEKENDPTTRPGLAETRGIVDKSGQT